MTSASGFLVALDGRNAELVKEARFGRALLNPFKTRAGKITAGAGLLGGTILGGAAAARSRGGESAIKTRGGTLYLRGANYRQFQKILKTQGKRAAARYALGLIRSKQARFVRKGQRKRASEETLTKEAALPSLAAIRQRVGSFARTLATGAKKPLIWGMAIPAAGVMFGLGAEIVDKAIEGGVQTKRLAAKPTRFRNTLKFVKKTSTPLELYNMGLGPDPDLGKYERSLSPAYKAELEGRERDKRKNLVSTFNLMYSQTPLVTTNPVVSAILLKDFTSKDSGEMSHDKLRQLLDIERSMGDIRSMSPFRIRAPGGTMATELVKSMAKNEAAGLLGA